MLNVRNVGDAAATAARGHACLLHRGQAQPPPEQRCACPQATRTGLPACWVGARLGHHTACAALDESENGKYS